MRVLPRGGVTEKGHRDGGPYDHYDLPPVLSC